jgi:hypothetical protein
MASSGCVSPSRTDGDYQLKAGNSAKSVASSVATALIAADLGGRHKAPGTYLSALLGELEKDASSVQGAFDSLQPPSPRADELRTELDALLSAALDGLSALRIEVRRGGAGRLPHVAEPLRETLTKLRELADRYVA